jgi:hypothetical protein
MSQRGKARVSSGRHKSLTFGKTLVVVAPQDADGAITDIQERFNERVNEAQDSAPGAAANSER